MDYVAEINKIESELTGLKGREINSTGEEKIFLNQRIIALENKSTAYAQLLLQHNARPGNC
jgi:hypothetical protein